VTDHDDWLDVLDEFERTPPECPYCRRVCSWREWTEQGACNDCYEGQR
jgi:hypothetical protein